MLTDDQVKRLFVYCEKKHVRYYDLQIELVDHLATAIEQAMVQQPGKIFEEIAGEKAPVFAREWKQIEQEKRKILSRGIWRQWRKELLAYFTWPKISLLVLLSSLMFFIDQQWHFHRFPRFGMSLLQLLGFTYVLYRNGKTVQWNTRHRKKDLLTWHVLRRIELLAALPVMVYTAGNLVDLLWPVPLTVSRIALYCLPATIICVMAWARVNISCHIQMRKNYAAAFEG